MEPLVFRPARAKLLLGSLGFVGGGAGMVLDERAAIVVWMSVLFFGGCAAVAVAQLVDTRARLVVDDRGVFDRTLEVGVIRWEDIVDAEVAFVGNPFIALRLTNAAVYTDRLGPVHRRLVQLNQGLGLGALNVNLTAIDTDPHALALLISREAEARKRCVTVAVTVFCIGLRASSR